MHSWQITSAFAAVAVAQRRHRTVPRFADVVTRGALLLDLAAARCVAEADDGAVRRTGRSAGFPPAEQLADSLDRLGVRPALVRTPVTLEAVVDGFVAERWWAAPAHRARVPWRRGWGEPADEYRRSDDVRTMATLLDSVFSPSVDPDDVLDGAAQLHLGDTGHLVSRVIGDLFAIRYWREGAARTGPGGGGG